MNASPRGGRFLAALRRLAGGWLSQRSRRIGDREALLLFLQTRASYVAQTALYGYLRTRAGMRYPALYDDMLFTRSVNIAKWHVWLACLSDLAVFAGGLLLQRTHRPAEEIGRCMVATLDAILQATGVPPDSGAEFAEHAQRVRARLMLCIWSAVSDDAAPFSESAPALVHWSPVVDELKRHDEQIVRNSIRFLWQDVRRDLRRDLDAAAVMAPAGQRPRDPTNAVNVS